MKYVDLSFRKQYNFDIYQFVLWVYNVIQFLKLTMVILRSLEWINSSKDNYTATVQ